MMYYISDRLENFKKLYSSYGDRAKKVEVYNTATHVSLHYCCTCNTIQAVACIRVSEALFLKIYKKYKSYILYYEKGHTHRTFLVSIVQLLYNAMFLLRRNRLCHK